MHDLATLVNNILAEIADGSLLVNHHGDVFAARCLGRRRTLKRESAHLRA